MPVQGTEAKQAALQVLSGINEMSKVGITDALIAANSTITALITAINNILPVTTVTENARQRICVLLRMATTIGALAESHTASTVLGLATIVAQGAGLDPAQPPTYFSE